MLKKVLLALVVLLVAFVAFVAMRPDRYHVERSATIAAPAERIYAQIADLRRWTFWSPWEGRDPAMQRTYSGAESGQGAVYAWSGNDQVGSGRMTIVESEPPTHVRIALEFITPIPNTAETSFTLAPAGDATRVTWAMDGDANFIGKLFGLFIDFDEMIGADYERGLTTLKRITEAPSS